MSDVDHIVFYSMIYTAPLLVFTFSFHCIIHTFILLMFYHIDYILDVCCVYVLVIA